MLSDSTTVVPPFRPDIGDLALTFFQDLDHGWNGTHEMFDSGKWDQWLAAKSSSCVAHMQRSDLPFHYALADAFTVCDAYHCSMLGPTDPNRYYMWTGWDGNDGDNSLLYFHQYQNVVPGSPLYQNARTGTDVNNGGTYFDILAADVKNGTLPSVSLIVQLADAYGADRQIGLHGTREESRMRLTSDPQLRRSVGAGVGEDRFRRVAGRSSRQLVRQ